MEATFTGRLGQKMHITGSPTEIATAYAYLMAADIQSVRAMEQFQNTVEPEKPKPTGKKGGYVDPPRDILNGENVEDIINGLLDWVIDQRSKENGGNDDGDSE